MVWRDSELKSGSGREEMNNLVNIGKSVQIKGELTGNEDLTIDGNFEGKIHMKDHALTVGPNGNINAEIRAKSVTILGRLVGNVMAGEKVEVAQSGTMEGDITSPRVILADGARFKGTIDMEGQRPKAGAKVAATISTTGASVKDARVTA